MAGKYKVETVVTAISTHDGMVHVAARALGCSPQTIYNYAKRHASVQEAIDNARELLLDETEQSLAKAARSGEAWAVCFLLKTLGKQRGYVERTEHTGADGGPVPILITKMRMDEL